MSYKACKVLYKSGNSINISLRSIINNFVALFCSLSYVASIFEESHVEEKTRELKGKDDLIAEKEKTIKEKTDSIASLQSEIASLQVSI